MRKLTKGTFSDQYRFKRLLQTQPELVKRYKRQQAAINSIPAVKDIAIYEGPESCEYVPTETVDPKSAETFTRLCRGIAEWPRRIIFPEQARQLYEDGRPMWSINLTVDSTVDYATKQNVKSYRVRIKRFDAPVIATKKKHVGWRPIFEPVPPDQIRLIENNDNVFFYLTDAAIPPENQDPWDIWSAGLVPNIMAEFNTCFYDRDVAQLYADSLRAEVHRIDKLHFRN